MENYNRRRHAGFRFQRKKILFVRIAVHLFADFIDMEDHIKSRAGQAVSLPVESIYGELYQFRGTGCDVSFLKLMRSRMFNPILSQISLRSAIQRLRSRTSDPSHLKIWYIFM